MQLTIDKTNRLSGEIVIPASKSHTIRALIIAAMAKGKSTLAGPLLSEDTLAAMNACRAIGAKIRQEGDTLIVEGCGQNPQRPDQALDMLNSGTSTNLMMGILAALGIEAEITGDSKGIHFTYEFDRLLADCIQCQRGLLFSMQVVSALEVMVT